MSAITRSNVALDESVATAEPWRPKSLGAKVGFVVLNLWIVLHLFAVIAAPVSVSPSSNLERQLWNTLSPYVQLLYQNNGFHFFAPNPEGSNSIRYEVELADGTVEQGKYPNRDIFPRLLYHRYFMITENIGQMEEPYQSIMIRDFARQVCRDADGVKVSLYLEWHDLARRERILAGGSIYDEDLYEVTPLGTFTWDELSKPSSENVATTVAE